MKIMYRTNDRDSMILTCCAIAALGMATNVTADELVGIPGLKSQPVHAGIELEPDHGVATPRGLEQLHLLDAVHDHLEAARQRLVELVIGEDTGEQHDRLFDAAVVQGDRLGQSGNRKCVGVAEAVSDRRHTVTIGIGFDHRHDPGVRRSGTNDLEIMLEGAEPNQRPRAKGHG